MSFIRPINPCRLPPFADEPKAPNNGNTGVVPPWLQRVPAGGAA